MPLYTVGVFLTLLSIGLTTITLLNYLRTRHRLPLPPGPPRWPIIANLFQVPIHNRAEVFHLWSTKYKSDVIYFSAAGLPILVLDTADAAIELLEKRSSIYSSRPVFTLMCSTRILLLTISMTFSGDAWRRQRKIFHQEFSRSTIAHFRPHELAGSRMMLRNLLHSPQKFEAHIKHFAGYLILLLAYGIEVHSSNDPLIVTAERAMEGIIVATLPGRFLVDFIPLLRYVPPWFPFANFKRLAVAWRLHMNDVLNKSFDMAKKSMSSSSAIPSVTSHGLEAIEAEDGQDRASMELDLQKATVSSLQSFFLEMTRRPDIQERAQREIDDFVGSDRLPSFDDENSLPYVTALLKEILRFSPVAPCAGLRELTADDVYKGYHMPAGSVVLVNVWAILHDPIEYPEPERFNPDRFLKDGKLNPEVKDPATAAFGFGRRICPARHMAMSSMWIAMVSILSCFDIRKAVDEKGVHIEPSGEYTSGIVTQPLPFKCSIRPRSPKHAALIMA
ncbi:cytochrome P450 [Stereum hirsutum FP-91666 SS1]|uniref:cytochrome P450 n=1 Tax=Stereum hirsutum (strain FP-91666) TaxID=721885 RepID=UPI000444A1B7|nr:cytochrome P450 [Stereum hirsutum FP-91666 SS1]EIM83841.1 cytochrome P450 [Stereum hirsutum FP-91666 SS1]